MTELLSAVMYLVDSFGIRNVITGMFALSAALYFLFRLFDRR